MNKRKITAVLLAISVVGSSFLFSSIQKVDPVLETATAIAKKLFYADEFKKEDDKEQAKKRETIISSYLQGLDGAEDYIISESVSGGYAIFEKASMELIEYSAVGGSPFTAIAGDYRGYAGPNAYFEKEGEQFIDIRTQKKLSKDKGVQVAATIKNKITTDRAERKEQLEKEKQEQEQELSKYGQINTSRAGPTGDKKIDADSYTILSQVHIPDYQFFVGNNGHGHNADGTCSSVATQLLLSYNNWAKDGRLLGDANLQENETIFLDDWSSNEQKPYSQERVGTTSETLDNGKTSFYEALLSYINPPKTTNKSGGLSGELEELYPGATTASTYNGIKNYLSTRLSGYIIWGNESVELWDADSDQIEDTLQDKEIYMSYSSLLMPQAIAHAKIIDEINNGRPVHTGITDYEFKINDRSSEYEMEFHDVIVYGYQTIIYDGQQLNGFIAHFGWKDSELKWDILVREKRMEDTHVWFNSSWAYRYITFAVGHEHANTIYPGDSHILECVCGATTPTSAHNYQDYEDIYLDMTTTHHLYHHKVCTCGYVEKEAHDFSIYERVSYDDIRHIIKCKHGCKVKIYGAHEYTRFVSQGSERHMKYCGLCGYQSAESHTFKNNATCMFCGELNPNRSEKK